MPVFRPGRNGYWFGVLILLQRCCLNHHSNGKTSAQTDTYNIWHALCMLKLNSSNSNPIQLNGYGYGSLLDYLVKYILQLRIRHIGRLQNVGASSGKIHKCWAGHKILRTLHLTFDWHYIGQIKVKISQNFVAFSEYMNFNRGLFEEKSFASVRPKIGGINFRIVGPAVCTDFWCLI